MKNSIQQKKLKEKLQKHITHRRLWLYRLMTITAIPILVFLLLEVGLRIVGYGYPSGVMMKNKVNGKEGYGENIKFGWRFFPRNIAREFTPFFIPSEKSNNTYRIFILGSSAAKGGQGESFGFDRILQVMLRAKYPEAQFEIINVAMVAINSHVVLEIAKDCVKHDPDLFIVYMGNNEVVGPYGAGTVFNPFSSSLTLIRSDIILKKFRIGQLLTNLIESIGFKKNLPKSWMGLEFFLEQQIGADNPRLETVYQHYERNLKDIIHVAHQNGTKIIIGTVGSNLKDNPPFASLHRLNLTETEREEWEEIYKQGVAYETIGKYNDAVGRYLAAGDIDDVYADLQYRLGRCYWAMAEYEKAWERYIQARQLDALRFRADSRINEIIRQVVNDRISEGVYLVDAVKVFEENSPNGIPGEELFYDHVHLTFSANYLVAKILFDQVEMILPERITSKEADDYPLLTEDECANHLAYTDWDRYKIAYDVLNSSIKNPPFTNQLYHAERIEQMEQTLNQIQTSFTPEVFQEIAAQYQQAIDREPSDWWLHFNYAELLSEGMNDDQTAYEAYCWVLNLLPHSYQVYGAIGYVLGKQGKFNEAITSLKKAIQIKPTSYQEHFFLGLAYQNQNKSDEATKHYLKTVQLEPIYAPAWLNIALLQYNQGKIKEAVNTCRKGLLFISDFFDLHYFLGSLLYEQGNVDEAVIELQAALKINPDSDEVQKKLEAILKNSI